MNSTLGSVVPLAMFFVFLINVARDIYKTCKEEKRARNENDERKTFRISQTVALSSLCQQDPRNQGSENKTFFTPLESSRPSLFLRFYVSTIPLVGGYKRPL